MVTCANEIYPRITQYNTTDRQVFAGGAVNIQSQRPYKGSLESLSDKLCKFPVRRGANPVQIFVSPMVNNETRCTAY